MDEGLSSWINDYVEGLVGNLTADNLSVLNKLFVANEFFNEGQAQPEPEEIEVEIKRFVSMENDPELRTGMVDHYHSLSWNFWKDWFIFKTDGDALIDLGLDSVAILKLLRIREEIRSGEGAGLAKALMDSMTKQE